MAVNYIGNAQADGHSFGQSVTDKISLYGKTPVVQPAATAQSAVATTAITTVETLTTTVWAASINSLISRVAALITLTNQVRSDLVTFGAIKGSI